MDDVLDAMPIVRLLRALQRRRDRLAVALVAAVVLFGAIALVTPVSRRMQRGIMAAHHFKPLSLDEWLLLQLAPKMYGFAHTAWIGSSPLFATVSKPTADRIYARQSFWVNHYPARRARFDGARGEVFAEPGNTMYVYLRSHYRGLEESTAFVVRAADGKLVLRRIEGFR